MQKILIKLGKTISGKKRFQSFFDSLHGHVLTAMNIGRPASHVTISGEISALEEVKRKLSGGGKGTPACLF